MGVHFVVISSFRRVTALYVTLRFSAGAVVHGSCVVFWGVVHVFKLSEVSPIMDFTGDSCVNQKSCYSVPPRERQVFFTQVEVGEGILGDPNAKS